MPDVPNLSNFCVAPDIEPKLECDQNEYKIAKGLPFNARVKVAGRPKCECEWTKDGTSWWEYARYGGGFAQISIPSTATTDEATYELVARNRAGEARTTLNIKVLGKSDNKKLEVTN